MVPVRSYESYGSGGQISNTYPDLNFQGRSSEVVWVGGLAVDTYPVARIFLYAMDLPTTLLHLQARRQLPGFDGQELVDWAVAALVAGYETEHLVMLAGMDGYPAEEKWAYFYRSVAELELELPPADRTALYAYAIRLAEDVVAGRVTWRAGIGRIMEINGAAEHDERYSLFVELEDNLDSLEKGYENYNVPGFTLGTAPEMIREAFSQFLAGETLGINPWQWGKVYCFTCGSVGAPAVKRDWLARLHLLPGKEVCGNCGSGDIAYFTDDTRRGNILDAMARRKEVGR